MKLETFQILEHARYVLNMSHDFVKRGYITSYWLER